METTRRRDRISDMLERQSVLDGLPALGQPVDTNYGVRAGRIMGLKPNILLRMIKEQASSVYRSAMKATDPFMNGHTKDESLHNTLAEIFCSHELRRKLMIEHAKQSYSGGRPERIPVIEYALIKSWNSKYDFQAGLAKGSEKTDEYHQDTLEFLLSSGVTKSICEVSQAELDTSEPIVARFVSTNFKPSFTARFYLTMSGDNSKRCWWTDTFNPYWIVPIADEILMEICDWSKKNEAARVKLAGAAFGASSIMQSSGLLRTYMDLQPELGLYLQGVGGLRPDQLWDGKVWPVGHEAQIRAEMSAMLMPLTELQCRMIDQAHPSHIESMRAIISSCEALMFSIAARSLENTKQTVSSLREALSAIVESFKVTGHELDLSALNQRLQHWECLLDDGRMSQPGLQQTESQLQVYREMETINSELEKLGGRFASANKQHEGIIKGELTWERQIEMLQELNGEINQIRLGFQHLEQTYSNLPKPELTLPSLDVSPDETTQEPEHNSDKEQLLEILEEEIEGLKGKVKALDSVNDSLRQDNASMRQQVESLKLNYNSSKTASPAESFSPALQSVIDVVAEDISPKDVLRLMEAMYPDRVRILKSAYSTASDHASLITASVLYQRLKTIVTSGLDTVRETGRVIDMQDIVSGELAVQESHTVRTHSRLKAFRTFRDGSKKRVIYTHLNLDYSTRLYFDYDQEEDLILVAYVGKHLPSAKSSTT